MRLISIYTGMFYTYSLSLLGLLKGLALTSNFCGFWSRSSIHHGIPPSETARVVSDKTLVVDIVMLGTSPEWQEMVQAPWEIVATMSIDGLEETKNDPDIHCKDVKVPGAHDPRDRSCNRAGTENHDFDRRRVLCGHTKRC